MKLLLVLAMIIMSLIGTHIIVYNVTKIAPWLKIYNNIQKYRQVCFDSSDNLDSLTPKILLSVLHEINNLKTWHLTSW